MSEYGNNFKDEFVIRAGLADAEAQTFIDFRRHADVFYGISRELIDADYTGTGAAAWVGRMHESMHGRHAGSASAACGCIRAKPIDPAAAHRSPPRQRPPPGPLIPRSHLLYGPGLFRRTLTARGCALLNSMIRFDTDLIRFDTGLIRV